MKKVIKTTKTPVYSVAVFHPQGWFQCGCGHKHETVSEAYKCRDDHYTTILGQQGEVVNDETLETVPRDECECY